MRPEETRLKVTRLDRIQPGSCNHALLAPGACVRLYEPIVAWVKIVNADVCVLIPSHSNFCFSGDDSNVYLSIRYHHL
jgi:hypothetical protein